MACFKKKIELLPAQYWRVCLVDICRGFIDAVGTASVHYHWSIPSRACRRKRKSGSIQQVAGHGERAQDTQRSERWKASWWQCVKDTRAVSMDEDEENTTAKERLKGQMGRHCERYRYHGTKETMSIYILWSCNWSLASDCMYCVSFSCCPKKKKDSGKNSMIFRSRGLDLPSLVQRSRIVLHSFSLTVDPSS